MGIKYICLFCNREFKRKEGLTQHKDYCQKDVNSKWYKEHKKECPKCGKSFAANREFCSRKCANSHFVSEDHKKKVSETLKQKYPKNNTIRRCLDCGKEISRNSKGYCKKCAPKHKIVSAETREKLRQAGKKSANTQKEKRRSKNEILFSELISENFKIVCNEPMFNGWDADIIIPSKKIAILWNGNWHYKEICGQLKQVQNRDRIKYSEIVKAGYLPYIIVDLGKFSKNKCEKEYSRFVDFVNLLSKHLD